MGKRQAKKTVGWLRLGVGAAVSLGVYLLGIFLIAFFIVKGFLAPEKGNLVLSTWVLISAACGSVPVLHIKRITPLLACLLQGCVFAVVLLAMSYLCWEGAVWDRGNFILLLSMFLGSLLPGLFAGGRRKRKRGW